MFFSFSSISTKGMALGNVALTLCWVFAVLRAEGLGLVVSRGHEVLQFVEAAATGGGGVCESIVDMAVLKG